MAESDVFDECFVFKKKLDEKIKANAERGNKQVKSNIEGDKPQFHEAGHSLAHIFGGFATYESERQYKAIELEVNLALTGPTQYLKWSEQPITFDQADLPAAVPHTGRTRSWFSRPYSTLKFPELWSMVVVHST